MSPRLSLVAVTMLITIAGLGAPAARPHAPEDRGEPAHGFSPLFELRRELGIRRLESAPGAQRIAAEPRVGSDPDGSPVSGLLSVCLASGCAVSVCLGSGCIQSFCFGSACQGSVCGGSACLTSGCAGSVCAGSGCLGSVCAGSACLGSACLNCPAVTDPGLEPPEA